MASGTGDMEQRGAFSHMFQVDFYTSKPQTHPPVRVKRAIGVVLGLLDSKCYI
jgi:hypothetical protein